MTPCQLRACLGPHPCPIFRPWCLPLAWLYPSHLRARHSGSSNWSLSHLNLSTGPSSSADTLSLPLDVPTARPSPAPLSFPPPRLTGCGLGEGLAQGHLVSWGGPLSLSDPGTTRVNWDVWGKGAGVEKGPAVGEQTGRRVKNRSGNFFGQDPA